MWIPEDLWDCPYPCEHEWGKESHQSQTGGSNKCGLSGGPDWQKEKMFSVSQGQFCLKCSAWRGGLGLEPNPDVFNVITKEADGRARNALFLLQKAVAAGKVG